MEETAEVVQDASFCQIYNEKNDQNETPMVDLDNKTTKSTSKISNISDTGKIQKLIEKKPISVYKNLGEHITQSFEEEHYSDDFESDDENDISTLEKITQKRKSVTS